MLTYGYQIQAWRHERDMTQNQLANLAGLSRPNLSRIERGQIDVTVATLCKIAAAFEILPHRLLDPQPVQVLDLKDRHFLDRLARAVISGEREFSKNINLFLDDVTGLIINLLNAHSCDGAKQVKRKSWDSPYRKLSLNYLYGSEGINRLLKRVTKLLS